jgi:hypothetical protein
MHYHKLVPAATMIIGVAAFIYCGLRNHVFISKRGTGIWVAKVIQYKFLFRGHDSLYIAAHRFRLRIMKPHYHKGW